MEHRCLVPMPQPFVPCHGFLIHHVCICAARCALHLPVAVCCCPPLLVSPFGCVSKEFCTDLGPLTAAVSCWCRPLDMCLRSSNTAFIWIFLMYCACWLVPALARTHHEACGCRRTQRLYALITGSRACAVMYVHVALPFTPNSMSCCIRRANHSTRVKVSGESWSITAATCGSASRSETRAQVQGRHVARNSMTAVCKI